MLPPELARRFYVGRLCPRGHRYEGSEYTLRKKSNKGCRACNDAYVRAGMSRNGSTPRPALPAHWEGRGFLSPVLCDNSAHRFRQTAYTLRFLDSELCVQCCTEAHPALVGD